MRKNSILISPRNVLIKNKSETNIFRKKDYKNVDFDSYVNVDIKKKLYEQINDINKKIENIGIICDYRKKKSYESYKSFLNSERKKLNNIIDKSIDNLKREIEEYKFKTSFDYSGNLYYLTKQVKNLEKDLENGQKNIWNLKEKKQILLEDIYFYSKELENSENLNLYLNKRLNQLKDLKNESIESSGINTKRNKSFIHEYSNKDNLNSQELKINQSSSVSSIFEKNKSNNNGGLLLTGINTSYNKPKNTYNRKFIEKNFEQKITYVTDKINSNLKKEDKRNKILKKHYEQLMSKSNNSYSNLFKNIINNLKVKELEPNLNELNQSSNICINSSYINSNNLSKIYNNQNDFIIKLKKKEIIIQFLENINVKKLIFHLLNNKK